MRTCFGILFLFVFLLSSHLFAVVPEDAIVLEGESFISENEAWVVKEHSNSSWYDGHPSGSKMLEGSNTRLGKASAVFELSAGGTYRLWTRYLDVDRRTNVNSSFTITVSQNDKTLSAETLNQDTLRKTEAGIKEWGKGWGQFVWQYITFTAEKGSVTLTLEKPVAETGRKNTAPSGHRIIDLFIITADEQYKADVRDVYPVFAKVRILPEQEKPCVIVLGGRRSNSPYYFTASPFIHRDGMAAGINQLKSQNSKFEKLEPGQSSPWVPLYKYLSFNRADMLTFSALAAPDEPVANAAFEIFFSTTQDDSGLILKETRLGTGCGIIVNLNMVTRKILTDREGSEQSLKFAKATTPVDGLRPMLYPFTTGMSLAPDLSQGEYYQNELDALSIIGINGSSRLNRIVHTNFPHLTEKRFIWHLMKNDCPNDPNRESIEKSMKEYSEQNAPPYGIAIGLSDEPNLLNVGHFTNCDVCAEAFQKYTAKQGVPMEGKPNFDATGEDAARYYWSIRFRNNTMTEFFRVTTEMVHKYMPELPTTANFAPEIVFDGNLISHGADWFEIFRSGSLTHAKTEDWNAYTGTYQTAGFQVAAMKAACRPKGYSCTMLNILPGRSAWDITAKGFCEIGHGCNNMHFFNYGPYYAPTNDAASYRAEIYQAIKEITYPTGGVEKYLTHPAAKPAKGDGAMLLSTTSDIWGAPTGNAYGRERAYLHLLLTHCGYRTDILNEDDLFTELKNYSVLFVTDSHLRAACLKPLADWVKNGGTLYLGAGALQFDEYNRPLGADALFGIKREPMELAEKAGNALHVLRLRKPVKQIGDMPVFVGHQAPYKTVFNSGKGKIIFSGFFPGLSYIASSKQISPDIYSACTFEPVYRDYIKSIALPAQPRIFTDNPLVETGLIESPDADVAVLSNWTGEQQTVTVTLRQAQRTNAAAVKVVGGTKFRAALENGVLSVKLNVRAGCYILLPKQ